METSSQSLRTESKFDRDSWMLTYGSLLTGVLAFFLLLVGRTTAESESIFKLSDNLTTYIGSQLITLKNDANYDWLYIENTGNRGIKILIPSEVNSKPFFESGQATISEDFLPYIDGMVDLIRKTDLDQLRSLYKNEIMQLENYGKTINVNIRVEGHTDPRNIKTANFEDNWDLSTARAYSVMNRIAARTQYPPEYFSLSGYAYFHPLHNVNNYDENRRVEIYLKVDMTDFLKGVQ